MGVRDWVGRPSGDDDDEHDDRDHMAQAESSVNDSRSAQEGSSGDQEPGDVPSREEVLFPVPRYQGEFTPQNLAFDSNLQEFAHRVSYICSLESAGKITPNDAHERIRDLWRQLKRSHRGLGIAEEES